MTSGMLDTSVVIDWHDPDVVGALPDEMAISAITAAELTVGPALASTAREAAKRQARLQEVESKLDPIPFDAGRGVASRTFLLRPQHMRTDSISTPATVKISAEWIIWYASWRSEGTARLAGASLRW